MASHLGIHSEYAHFHEGFSQEALFSKYSQSRVFLYGSHTECQPLVLLDSMASGTPFISRASGSIPFMSGGISVTTEEEAASALNLLLKNQDAWEQLSDAGRNEAMEKHSPDIVGEAMLAMLIRYLN
jgi:glycosyltransferase involved in cell wall biosynthesis